MICSARAREDAASDVRAFQKACDLGALERIHTEGVPWRQRRMPERPGEGFAGSREKRKTGFRIG